MIPKFGPTEMLICIAVIGILAIILIVALIGKIAKPKKSTPSMPAIKPVLANENTEQFHTKIAGVTYPNDDGTSRQDIIHKYCQPGMALTLMREPDNPHSSTAIAVYITTPTGPSQIGYISENVASELSPFIKAGHQVKAEIANITGGAGEKETIGVNILITKYLDTTSQQPTA